MPPTTAAYAASGGSGGGAAAPAPSGFNLNPAPQSGQGAFGAVPGPLGLPNPAADLGAQIPGLSGLNQTGSQDIQSLLGGTLSPGTQNALQNAGATFGVESGMPGSGLSWNSIYGNIAGASAAQQQQGLQDYSSFIPTVSGTQTVSPTLQNEIATQNSLNAAAPNPAAAASYAEQLFNQYQQAQRGPGGGTAGASGPDEFAQAYNAQYGPGSGYDGTPAPLPAPATATPALPGYSDPFSDSNAWATLDVDTPLDYAVD